MGQGRGFISIGGIVLSIPIGLLGLIFILALPSDKTEDKLVTAFVGLFLLAVSAAMLYFFVKKAPDRVKRIEVTQKVDLSGDTELEKLHCKSCGGALDSSSLVVAKDGSVLVTCPYCSSSYQITEKPTW